MIDIKLYAAPMEGLTTYIWRRAQRDIFGGADKYFTPFLSPNGNLAFQRKELDEVTQGEGDVVPQLLTNRGDHFVWAARRIILFSRKVQRSCVLPLKFCIDMKCPFW